MAHEAAIAELRALLGERLVTTRAELDLHGQNETYYPFTPPDAVAYPETTEEVSGIVRICNAHRCPIVAYGAASSLEGQHLAVQGGISLDMGRMNKVLAVNDADLNVVVQPGITRIALNEELRATGLFFSVDPGANASVGGMAATRASGTTAVRYGTMRDNVLALEAVMADGTIIRAGSGARKSSTGYDLAHLLIGSEGTLGIITELTLRLHGIPETVAAATCRFPTVEDAVNCVIVTIQSGLPMARIELLDEMMVRAFKSYAKADLPEVPHLFLEFHGSAVSVAEQMEVFSDLASDFGAEGWKTATSTEERNALWAMRHKSHYASAAFGEGGHIWPTDVCVPISRLADCISETEADIEEAGLIAPIVGHAGDGNFHVSVLVDDTDPKEIEALEKFVERLNIRALSMGGTCTGEHGIGQGKMKFLELELGGALDVMRSIKRALDPDNIMNPGKIVTL